MASLEPPQVDTGQSGESSSGWRNQLKKLRRRHSGGCVSGPASSYVVSDTIFDPTGFEAKTFRWNPGGKTEVGRSIHYRLQQDSKGGSLRLKKSKISPGSSKAEIHPVARLIGTLMLTLGRVHCKEWKKCASYFLRPMMGIHTENVKIMEA